MKSNELLQYISSILEELDNTIPDALVRDNPATERYFILKGLLSDLNDMSRNGNGAIVHDIANKRQTLMFLIDKMKKGKFNLPDVERMSRNISQFIRDNR